MSEKLSEWLYYLLAAGVALCLLMFFLAENGRANAFATYIVGLGVIGALFQPDTRKELLTLPLPVLVVLVIFLEYLSVSAWWSDVGSLHTVIRFQGYSVLIVTFIAGFYLAGRRFENYLHIMAGLVTAAAMVSAGYSIYLHFALPEYQPLPEPRLYGLGRLSNPVISAVSYGFSVALAFWLLLQRRDLWLRLLLAAGIVSLLVAISLSGTRIVWLALACAVGVALSLETGRNGWLTLGVAGTVLGAVAIFSLGWEDLAKRGLSFRPEIWAEFARRSAEANPILGAGSGAPSYWVTPELTFRHPHSIFVSAFFFGGIIGLGLLVALIVLAARYAWQSPPSPVRTLAVMTLSYGVVVGLIDGDNIVTKIDYLWWLIWFPLAVVMMLPKPQSSS